MSRAVKSRMGGQATIEFIYVVPILLLLLLASLQFVFVYEAKQTLNYATFAATREGALKNGSMAAIRDGLTGGMAPLFNHGEDLAALKKARCEAKSELSDSALTRIQIVNPTAGALAGFGASGGIPNDNLMYRDSTDLEDGMNVQDANLLKVRVRYCVRLVVPIVNRMIHGFANGASTVGIKSETYTSGAISATDLLKSATTTTGLASATTAVGQMCQDSLNPIRTFPYRLCVTSESVVRMQSPFKDPGQWTAP